MKTARSTEPYENIYLYKRIAHAKLFIDSHYAEKIDLTSIADEACFSKFHFIRLFKESYGYTPHNYLMKVRIEKAKLLLRDNVSVSDASMAVGFESTTSFAGRFKQLVGQTPSSFQKAQQKRESDIRQTPHSFVPNCFINTYSWFGE
jgi:AraC-like DNA-binding protein